MPLGPAIEAFAQERRGLHSRRARLLAALLADGVSLPDALARCRGLLPPHAGPMIRVGCQSGDLAAALRQAASTRNLYAPVWFSLAGKLTYLCLMLIFGINILNFFMIRILPQFIKIFHDFGAELPAMTQQLFRSIHWFDDSGLAMLLIVMVNLLFLYAVARRFGWIHWDLPGMGRLMRRADTALILDSLGLAATKDRPMLDAVRDLEESYPKPAVRRRLRRAAAALAAGEDWCESLFRQGLIGRADRAILLAAQRVGNLPWACGKWPTATAGGCSIAPRRWCKPCFRPWSSSSG